MFTRTERLVRWIVRLLVRALYRVRARGLDAVPPEGPALIVANHVSYVDALILGALCERPVRFVVDHRIHDRWPLRWFFELCGAIPIASRREDPARLARAMARIDGYLAAGEVVGLFPEGRLTRDGELCEFRPGVERVLARRPVPVVPVALKGLWGSVFSYAHGAPLGQLPRRFWSRIEVVAGAAIPPAGVDADRLRDRIASLLAA